MGPTREPSEELDVTVPGRIAALRRTKSESTEEKVRRGGYVDGDDLGGSMINMNVISRDQILEAHADPSRYPDLIVRVTGYSAYFRTLSPQYRQQVVDRFLAEARA
jgi:pyruvate-formate lyase